MKRVLSRLLLVVLLLCGTVEDAEGRITETQYDSSYRLDIETIDDAGSVRVSDYDYDDANNRTALRIDGDGTHDEVSIYDYTGGWNQLQTFTKTAGGTVTDVSFGYDDNGNRTSRSEDSVVTDSYDYDPENRLIEVTKGSDIFRYDYDYHTRRVVRDESGATVEGEPGASTAIVFSGGTSVQEWNEAQLGTGAPEVSFIRGSDWGGGGILYSLRPDAGAAGGFAAGFNLYNSRGDVIAKTDEDGKLTWQGEYEAYGTRTHEIGENKDRQRGNTKDEDPTGLLNEHFRYRDLETGAWMTRDPAGFVDGPNLYAYVKQNPWTHFDPEGLSIWTKAFKLAKNGGDIGLTTAGLVSDFNDFKSARTFGQAIVPAMSMLSEVLPVSGGDVKDAWKFIKGSDGANDTRKSVDNLGDTPKGGGGGNPSGGGGDPPSSGGGGSGNGGGGNGGGGNGSDPSSGAGPSGDGSNTPIHSGEKRAWEDGADPNSIYVQKTRDGDTKSISYYDENGKRFSREDYKQNSSHKVTVDGKKVDLKNTPHEHQTRTIEGPKGPYKKKQVRTLDEKGKPTSSWTNERDR